MTREAPTSKPPEANLPKPGTLGLLACVVAIIVSLFSQFELPILPLTAFLTVGIETFATWSSRKRGSERDALVHAVSLLPLAIVLSLLALRKMAEPLVHNETGGFVCGGAGPPELILVPGGFMFAGWVGTKFALLFGHEQPGIDKILRAGAWAVVGLGILLAGQATCLRMHRHDADGYVRSLPIAARLSAWTGVCHESGSPVQVVELNTDAVHVVRSCWYHYSGGTSCPIRLTRPEGQAVLAPSREGSTHETCGAIEMRHDLASGFWIASPARDADGHSSNRSWNAQLITEDLTVGNLAHHAAPPWGWIYGAWAGIALALVYLLAGLRLSVEPSGSWREGWHHGGGYVSFGADGEPVTIPHLQAPVGAVIVQGDLESLGIAYRRRGLWVPDRVLAGTLDDLAFRRTAWRTVCAALAIGSVVLAGAPLLACALRGLMT